MAARVRRAAGLPLLALFPTGWLIWPQATPQALAPPSAEPTLPTAIPPTYNRFNVSISSGMPATNWVLYLTDASRAFMMSTDPHATNGLLIGQLRTQQQSSYSASNLSGSFVAYESAAMVPTTSGTQGYFTNLMQGSGDGAGNRDHSCQHDESKRPGGHFVQRNLRSYHQFERQVRIWQRLVVHVRQQSSHLAGRCHEFEQPERGPRLAGGTVRHHTVGDSDGMFRAILRLLATPCTTSVPFPYFTGNLPSFDATMSSESGILTLDGSGNIGFTQDFVGRGTASLDNIFSGLVTDWTAMGWPNTTYGTFQVDNGGNAQMYCAVVSAGDSPILGFPNGRAICANAPGESIGVSSAGRPSITILQQ